MYVVFSLGKVVTITSLNVIRTRIRNVWVCYTYGEP